MKILWSPFAVDDLAAIHAFIAEQNPRAAKAVAQRILEAVDLLSGQPHLGALTHRVDVRKLVVAQSPCVIPYRVVGDEIEILEVFDGRQRAPRTDIARR